MVSRFTAYLESVIDRLGRKYCRPVSTRLKNQARMTHVWEAIETTEFQAVIGYLMNVAVGTQPAIV